MDVHSAQNYGQYQQLSNTTATMFTMSFFSLASCLAIAQIAHAGFNPNVQSNVAVYWGQNSYGQSGSQQRLSAYCSSKFRSTLVII